MKNWIWSLMLLMVVAVFSGRVLGESRAEQGDEVVDLPVTKAVLFSSGVGYFEHTGVVEGNATLRVMFKADQINDVLKSMVLMDLDGGRVASVTYNSNEPLSRTLRSFGVDISGNPSLHELLSQLRGAVVSMTAPDKITGSILNVQGRIKVVGQPPAQITEYVLNLVTDSGIRSVPLDSVGSLTFEDPKLRSELNQALALLVASRDTDRKPVEIRFMGTGRRRVQVGYLVETPVWKTSYRLDLTGGKPFLQGWAIVENTGETDWAGVNLSLVSGRPISFVQDLYTPLFVPRPIVVPPQFASLQPRMYDEGLAKDDGNAVRLRAAGEKRRQEMKNAYAKTLSKESDAFQNVTGRMTLSQMAPAAEMADRSDSPVSLSGGGVQSFAQAGSMGELFRFTIDSPVDMARRRSAMLPIINSGITAEKVSIYNQSVLAKHPLNGVLLTNTTKLKMLAGPVTVFDEGSYAGDAQIDHLEPGDKRLISYAVDLSVTVDASVAPPPSRITAASIVKGVLRVTRVITYAQTYKIKNKAEVDRTVIIEHPFYSARKLIEPKTFDEKTGNLYRFRVSVKAGGTGEFLVREDQPSGQYLAILDQPAETFVWYSNSGEMPRGVRQALARAIELKNTLTDAQRRLDALQNELNKIKEGQDRYRRNISTVGRDTPQGRRYLDKMSQQEDRIDELEGARGKQGLIDVARKEMEASRTGLEDYLKNLNVTG